MRRIEHNDTVAADIKRKQPFPILIVGGILLAFTLYIYQLDGASLWRDEGLSVARAQQPFTMIFANRNIVNGVAGPDLHPPLYFLTLHGWRLLAGESEFALRYPSVLFMILAVALFYAVGKRLWGCQSGSGAISLAIFSPFFLWYAQEARMYALVAMESLLLLYTLWPLLRGQARWGHALSFALTLVALSFTHYSGLFLVAFALFAWGLVQFQTRFRWRQLAVLFVVVGAALWFLYPHVSELVTAPRFIAFSQRPLQKIMLEAVNTFSLGSAGPMENPGWRLLPFIALGLIGAFTSITRPTLGRWRASLVSIGGFTIPLLLFFIASWLQANYSNPRHLIILSVPWYLLMGHGLAMLWRQRRWLAAVFGLGVLVAAVPTLTQTITNPPIAKDDVRSLASYIEARMQPGDVVIWHNAVMMITYDYYALDLPYEAIPPYGLHDEAKALERLEARAAVFQRIWFVEEPPPYYFDKNSVRDWLDEHMVRANFAEFPASWASLNIGMYHWPQTSLPTANRLEADLHAGVYHVQAAASDDTAIVGEGMWWSVLWSAAETAVPPPAVCLRLRDSTDVIWTSGCATLTRPKNQEPGSDNLLTQQIWLTLPDGLAPIPYTVELLLGDTVQTVGTITVAAADDFLLETINHYDNGLSLVGLEWEDEPFRAGLWAVGNLIWQTESALEPGWRAKVRIVDWLGRSLTEQETTLGPADYPAEQWQAGDTVRSFVGIRLPFDLNGRYRVQLQLTDKDGNHLGRNWKTIGWTLVEPWPIIRQLPDSVTHRLENVFWGDSISLAGYDFVQAGDELSVRLYWRNKFETDADYAVFVHVGQPGTPPIAQSSGGPASWTRPTTSWRQGEIIEDVHTIQLPSDQNMEENMIFVGMYEINDPDVRVPITAADEPVSGNVWPLETEK